MAGDGGDTDMPVVSTDSAPNGAQDSVTVGLGKRKHMLRGRTPNLVLKYTLRGHDKPVTTVKYSPNGAWIATACACASCSFPLLTGRMFAQLQISISKYGALQTVLSSTL